MVVATQAPSRFEVRRRRSRELSASAASASASAASTAAGAVRATRIVATLGPASADRGVLDAMVAAGMDVARVNCSHGSPATWQQASRLARQAGTRIGRPVGVLFDISGPKMRVAGLSDPGLSLTQGELVELVGPSGGLEVRSGRQPLPLTFDPTSVEASSGDRVLLDDGRLAARVVRATEHGLLAEVERGGLLRPGKGVCLPDSRLSLPAIGPKDRRDLAVAAVAGAETVALSFVERAADVETARRLLPPGVAVLAKIERAAAVDNLDELLAAADGIMVARGDLGVELPLEALPLVQKDLVAEANRRGRPVICATEMLESMTSSHRPTRAEATDVANAVLDGVDAVMLSAETAVGADPANAVAAMAAVVAATEASAHFARTQPERSMAHPRPLHPGFLAPRCRAADPA